MPKISSYTTTAPASGDLLIGSDLNATPAKSTKNFTVGSILALGTPITQVLNSSNVLDQVNSSGTVVNIVFGSATSNTNISLAANGEITFLTAANYLIETTLNVGQVTGSGLTQVNSVSYGSFLNGTQFNETKVYSFDVAANVTNFFNTKTDSFILQVSVNDVLKFGYRASNITAGFGNIAVSGLSSVPSSSIIISKI